MVLGVVFATAVLGGEATPALPGRGSLAHLEGDWDGKLDAGALKLRIILHVHTQDGATQASVDSPDQNANGLPATVTLSFSGSVSQESVSGRC